MKGKTVIPILLISFIFCSCAKEDTFTYFGATSPEFPAIYLNSYEELACFVIPEEEKVQSTNIYDCYKTALSRMIAEGIPIPCKAGEPVRLDDEDTSRITVFPRELYSASCIAYDTTSNNEWIWVRISLERDISSTFTDEDSGSEIVHTLAPKYVNLHNAQEHTDAYAYVGERIIATSNGEKNMLYKIGTENREYFTFMQNGYVVNMFAKQGVLTEEWFKDFGIELLPVSNVATTE